MKEIPLTQEKVATVDDADYVHLMQWKWRALRTKTGVWYALRTACEGGKKNHKCVYMHRLLLPGVQLIDHKNGNGLDNQRHNLRPSSTQNNCANQSLSKDNTSGYKGVHWKPSLNKWEVLITANRQKIYVGLYKGLIDAAVAYDEAAKLHFGDFARLNFYYDPACYI